MDEGTLVFDVAEGTKWATESLVGPTTATIVASRGSDAPWLPMFNADNDLADPICSKALGFDNQNGNWSSAPNIFLRSPVATAAAGKTMTTEFLNIYHEVVTTTVFGPSIAYYTITTVLQGAPFRNPIAPEMGWRPDSSPGRRCGGNCNNCQLYFQAVYVYYWPVDSPNTACLSSNDMGGWVNGSLSFHEDVRQRGLSGLSGSATTLISAGFTLQVPCQNSTWKMLTNMVAHLLQFTLHFPLSVPQMLVETWAQYTPPSR